jgi:hypothetical protein
MCRGHHREVLVSLSCSSFLQYFLSNIIIKEQADC